MSSGSTGMAARPMSMGASPLSRYSVPERIPTLGAHAPRSPAKGFALSGPDRVSYPCGCTKSYEPGQGDGDELSRSTVFGLPGVGRGCCAPCGQCLFPGVVPGG